MLRLGKPGVAASWLFTVAGLVWGRESRRSSPRGTSDSTRLVQPYFVAAATTLIAVEAPGLFQVGSVSASHVKPPP